MSKRNSKTPLGVLVCVALLIALQVVLSRWLSISLPHLKIGFSFVPVMVAARLFGPLGGVAVYALGDVIGTFAFPTTGAYFPGFTLSAAVSGLIYGLFLYKKSSPARIIMAVTLKQLVQSVLLNTLWLTMIKHTTFAAELAIRWPQALGMLVVECVLMIPLLERICEPIESKMFPQRKKSAAEMAIEG